MNNRSRLKPRRHIVAVITLILAVTGVSSGAGNTSSLVPTLSILLHEDVKPVVLREFKAFPTAFGAGANITGGRGGNTCFVDTLIDSSDGRYDAESDSYAGSLRYCLEENPSLSKTVVFLVGGEFRLTQGDLYVNKKRGGNLTLAGQTARDLGGVHIHQGTYKLFFDNIYNLIIRFVDFKLGVAFADNVVEIGDGLVSIDGSDYPTSVNRYGYDVFEFGGWTYIIDGTTGNIVREDDGLSVTRAFQVMIDHVTAGFHADESFSIGGFHTNGENFDDITVQRSLMLPGIQGHNVGSIFGTYFREESHERMRNLDVHHNLWVNATYRHPNTGGGPQANIRIFNNVIYGWHSRTSQLGGDAKIDIFNNYYKKSPATGTNSQRVDRLFKFHFGFNWNDKPLVPSIYLNGNFIEGVLDNPDDDNWPTLTHMTTTSYGNSGTTLARTYQRTSPLTAVDNRVEFTDANAAYNDVLADVGEAVRYAADGTTYYRDPVAQRFLNYVINGTGPTVIPSSDDWVFPEYPSRRLNRNDFDADGVPINWRLPAHVVNPAGYSKQELYLAEMAGDFYRLRRSF